MMKAETVAFVVLAHISAATVYAQQPSDGTRSEPGAVRNFGVGGSPAIDAALGRPSPGAQYDPSTRGAPGWTDSAGQRPSDQTYRSSMAGEGEHPGAGIDYGEIEQDISDDPTPEFHIVQKNDTLWGISQSYYRDPYAWPKLWSYNEHITNPHWIFPGDRVRLTDPYDRPENVQEPGQQLKFSKTGIPVSSREQTYVLNQYAYVDAEQFEEDMKVIGGGEAKVMMATLDVAYMSYDKEQPPIPGERLSVYRPHIPIKDPDSRDVIGYLVVVVGEIEVSKVARKAAEGTIEHATSPVERGHRVGQLRRKFRRIDPKPAARSHSGVVVRTVRGQSMSGEEQFVIINLGAEDGVETGHVLEVVRKGDEYTSKHDFEIPYEDGWPRRLIGTVLVVDVQKRSSLGVVTLSRREIEKGEHVELRGQGMEEPAFEQAGRKRGRVGGNVRDSSGSGRAQGSAQGEFRLSK